MSREWKPGDVAMVGDMIGLRVAYGMFGCPKTHAHDGAHWHRAGGDWVIDDAGFTIRPLVVIDPTAIPHFRDFDPDVRTALHIIADDVRHIGGGDLDATEEIVQWLANLMPKPPKPDEPTGLGAVVEDAKGRKWVRSDDTDCVKPWHRNGSYDDSEYADIDAARVISEGVTS